MSADRAKSYLEPESPQERSRRQFLASATIGVGTVIGLVLGVPLLGSLVPPSLAEGSVGEGEWRSLPPHALESVAAKAGAPVSIEFTFPYADAYLPVEIKRYAMWGIAMNEDQERTFRAKRPELFAPSAPGFEHRSGEKTFAIFSGVCPHLGCEYEWKSELGHFQCPCHGSEFGTYGEKLKGPTLRGLDPLPLREYRGNAEITWIVYGGDRPDRVVVAYV